MLPREPNLASALPTRAFVEQADDVDTQVECSAIDETTALEMPLLN
jgi:hypothetical protein